MQEFSILTPYFLHQFFYCLVWYLHRRSICIFDTTRYLHMTLQKWYHAIIFCLFWSSTIAWFFQVPKITLMEDFLLYKNISNKQNQRKENNRYLICRCYLLLGFVLSWCFIFCKKYLGKNCTSLPFFSF